MVKIGKYEFDSKEDAQVLIDSLGFESDEEGNNYPNHKHTTVLLGQIELVRGEYDEEGNEITPPILSEKYHIDILWSLTPNENGEVEEPTDFVPFKSVVGDRLAHNFSGLDYNEYKF